MVLCSVINERAFPLSVKPSYFIPFQPLLGTIAPPKKFTYPFCYQPHQLAILAAQQLQSALSDTHPLASEQAGKMYGVLVVRNHQDQLGFLAAFSGKELVKESGTERGIENSPSINFVPPVFDAERQDEFFVDKQREVNEINAKIAALCATKVVKMLQLTADSEQAAADWQIGQLQQQHRDNRQQRKQQRQHIEAQLTQGTLSPAQAKQVSIELSRQSVSDKKALAALKAYWQQRIELANSALQVKLDKIAALKKARRKLSNMLQKRLFKQYKMLNSKGEYADLISLFAETKSPTPPAGSGDCAAPKLLQYAFEHQLTPVCMAEFWWGQQPSSEIRKHGHYYPACQGKCQPILTFMLQGLALDDNPLLINPGAEKPLPIVYQDEHLVVVNKPAGLLSVPGVTIADSVATRIQAQFPEATGGLVLHRLDMATSGLLVLALNERAHKHLQKQFINKVVQKQYVALLEGKLTNKEVANDNLANSELSKQPSKQLSNQPTKQASGEIHLPLILDIDDRPRQKVCFTDGKRAETLWQLLGYEEHGTDTRTRVKLTPVTGRTHQLRVHCAHPDGLNIPIVGDKLYGTSDKRLHLHAQHLSFLHPISQQRLHFEVAPEF
ncbi:RluA family pseudouridine synthase [Thalassotalea euphylliae]|uniref:RluA family pseudouridine synthase n=1 Tax=Thalassotalea euphylliae TaxID=1655234 RepID=A0A3E0UCB7_9GAMM|nr:RluA family pseudouridine synthase [Thalassotalea euphylliae]REL34233.1 RluA family pseudouridine synthase [Thalassotalea euphylliae]